MKKGGLKDENVIVFMYDDIAFDKNNFRPGVIINKPNGDDIYEGVPKVFFIILDAIFNYELIITYINI